MTLSMRPVSPELDGDLIHAWVREPRARFWGMTERSRDEVVEIYSYIDHQPHLSARLVLLGEEPVAILQTYDPDVDEIGEHYDRAPGDLGLHLFLANTPARAGHTSAIVGHMIEDVFTDPDVSRLVFEPDAANEPSISLLSRLGALPGPVTEFPNGKTAQFMFITRPSSR